MFILLFLNTVLAHNTIITCSTNYNDFDKNYVVEISSHNEIAILLETGYNCLVYSVQQSLEKPDFEEFTSELDDIERNIKKEKLVTGSPTIKPTPCVGCRPRTNSPSTRPTMTPTSENPTSAPSVVPSSVPSTVPTVIPSSVPTVVPTVIPSVIPSAKPSAKPTTLTPTNPTIPPT